MAASILLVALAFSALYSAEGVPITIKNSCPFTVWPGWISGDGGAIPPGGGRLDPSQSLVVDAPQAWAGRFWGRTGCTFDPATGQGTCQTGNCGNTLGCGSNGGETPATLAEFKLNGFNNNDFYDVSLVDGYNLPIRVTPSNQACTTIGCHSDVNANCPSELQVVIDGRVVGCKSACEAFQTDAFCCKGAFGQPQTCPPTGYSQLFKQHCPQAYSYAYDDLSSTFTCSSGSGYVVEFCPPGDSNNQKLLERSRRQSKGHSRKHGRAATKP